MNHTKHDTDGPCRECIREVMKTKNLKQYEVAKLANVSTGGLSEYLNKVKLHPNNHKKIKDWLDKETIITTTKLAPVASDPQPKHKRVLSDSIQHNLQRAFSDLDSETIGEFSTSNEYENDIFRSQTPDCAKNEPVTPNFLMLYKKYEPHISLLTLPPNYKDIKEYGFVYILTDNEKRVKIGITRDLTGRTNNLFSGNPDLRVAGFYASWFYLYAETCIHKILSDLQYKNRRNIENNIADSSSALSGATEFFNTVPNETLFLVGAVVVHLEQLYQLQK